MTDAQPPSESKSGSRGSLLVSIRLAASFLTLLPVAPTARASPREVAASFGWFPLIGFAIGGLLAIEDRLLTPIFMPGLRAVLIVATLAAITGGLHLDGLADTADALAARKDREHALEILRDSRIGVFGTLALIFVLALKCVAIASLPGSRRAAALYVAPGLARWAMVAVSQRITYLREPGAGSALLSDRGGSYFMLASTIAVLALIPITAWWVCAAVLAAALTTSWLRWFYRRWLGGVTGDLIGAAGELVEVTVLLCAAAFSI